MTIRTACSILPIVTSLMLVFHAGAYAAPDTIFVNGKIITVDNRFRIAEAVAIEGDRFSAVGTSTEIRKLADNKTEVIDLEGRTVIPGLIDSHMHVIVAGEHWWQEVRLDEVSTHKEALTRIAEKSRSVKKGEWILVLGGWSVDQFLDEPRGFTRAELDSAAPDNPVLVQEFFMRGFANSLALKAAGIGPRGGKPADEKLSWGTDAAGNPTGEVFGFQGIGRVFKSIPPVGAGQWDASVARLFADLNRVGLTSVMDPGWAGKDEVYLTTYHAPIERLAAEHQLSVRVFYTLMDSQTTPDQAKQVLASLIALKPFRENDFYQMIGIGEQLYKPVSDSMYVALSPKPEDIQTIQELALELAKAGRHLQIHAQRASSISMFLDAFEAANKEYPINLLHWTFAHGEGITAREIKRMRAMGMRVTASSRPSIQGKWLFRTNGNSISLAPPLRLFQNSGILWGLNSDSLVVAPSSPFITLWWATTGKMLDGSKTLEQTVDREDALIAHTRSNARVIFQGDNLGSIEPGKLADMVVIDRDYLTIPSDDIKNIKVLKTIVGGRKVFQR